MTATLLRLTRPFAAIAAACLTVLSLASCGGGVSASTSPVVDSAAITILPGTAVMYSGLPTTFILSGGTGAYIVASSNQAILAISGGVTGRSITLVPNPVTADTTVTLTVRDTGTAAPVSATVTVKPGTVNNNIEITRTSTNTGCTGAAVLCSGGDGLVSVTLSQGGIPLAARGVRFEALSGDFRFITSPPNVAPEVLELSQLTATDQAGVARVRVRVLPVAPNQTVILQVTDVVSGAYQRVPFFVAQVTTSNDTAFYTIPSTVTFTGSRAGVCVGGGASSDFFVFGGTPPYTVSGTAGAALPYSPLVVSASGGRFTVFPQGTCFADPGVSLAITDASGRTITARVINAPGTAQPPALVVAPTTVTLDSCATVATVSVVGGAGSYLQPTSTNSAVFASLATFTSGSATLLIRRASPSPAPGAGITESIIGVSDGSSIQQVTAKLIGAALTAACP